ncbi:MAG: hypothetical protein AB7S54_10250 [Bacteroidales bacterium]
MEVFKLCQTYTKFGKIANYLVPDGSCTLSQAQRMGNLDIELVEMAEGHCTAKGSAYRN